MSAAPAAASASFRRATLLDVLSVRTLFERALCFDATAAGVTLPRLMHVIQAERLPAGEGSGRCTCIVAELEGAVVGAILTAAVPARARLSPAAARAALAAGAAGSDAGSDDDGDGGGEEQDADRAALFAAAAERKRAAGVPPPPPKPKPAAAAASPPPPPPPATRPFDLPFDLLREPLASDDEVVIILAIAVARERRRQGIGTELLYAGVRAHALEQPSTAAALFYAPLGHAPSTDFIETFGFKPFGRRPCHYTSADGADQFDALAYASAMGEGRELEAYTDAEGGEEALPDLDDPQLPARKARRASRWLWDGFVRYLLPFAILLAIFLVCYLLVRLGPLAFLSEYVRPASLPPDPRLATPAPPPPRSSSQFAAPPGISIKWVGDGDGGGGGNDEL